MSETESISIAENLSLEDEFPDDDSSVFLNERGDCYYEESSAYRGDQLQIDHASKNKKFVWRVNPDTGKRVRIEFFPTSMTPNSHIKNAMTGIHQFSDSRPFRVGTKDEDLFFTIILATGELGQMPPTLFYDNPEQYERHFFTKLSRELKNDWENKRDHAMSVLKNVPRRTGENGTILVK
jgi:hypothetical protein